MKLNLSLATAMLACAIAAAPALAQTPPPKFRVGLLATGPEWSDQTLFGAALMRGFTRNGFVQDQNVTFERRGARGQPDRLPQLLTEILASKPAVVITGGYPAALVAKQRTTLPVVVVMAGDPVQDGLVESFAHPGGHLTGLSEVAAELSAKRLGILKEALPSVHRVAMLWNDQDLGMTLRYRAAEARARSLGLEVTSLGVHAPEGFGGAFTAMTRDPPDAILMVSDVLTTLNRKRVIDFAAAHKMPAVFEYDSLVHEGGLMSYGPDVAEMFDRAAGLAARILQGANPADLPLETPTRFVLAINLATAKKIGVVIPPSLLARADDVVE
jgi:putative ABC transport system substrate-binding protein